MCASAILAWEVKSLVSCTRKKAITKYPTHVFYNAKHASLKRRKKFMRAEILPLSRIRGRIQRGKKTLENPPENSPENQLEISYTGKSPKIGSLDMS